MKDASPRADLIDQLAEEFLTRFRRGERPAVQEYAAKYPEYAAQIRDLFPALVVLEQAAPASDSESASPATAPRAESSADLPERLGDYRIVREIGRGGMGVVYEAEQQSLGRRVALKVLPGRAAQDAKVVARFHRESRAAAQLHHSNIVPVYEVGEEAGQCYYAMQFIRGQALDEVFRELQRLRSGGEPGPAPDTESAALPDRSELSSVTSNFRRYCRNVARLGLQAAEALAYAHGRGIVHRDIKPANLLLDTTGVLWVSDFGLVKTQDPALTETGDLVGTLRYMAPERFQGECDSRADIYALGLTLYELLVLRPAFDGTDRLHLVEQIGRQEPTRLRTLDSRIPRDLETVIAKAIEKDPRRRYASAEALAEDLRRFLADEPIRARRTGPLERLGRWGRRNPLVASLSAAILVVAALGFAGVFGQWQVAEANAAQAEKKEQEAIQKRDEVQALNEKLLATQAQLQRTLYAAHMNLAQHAWEKARISRVLELLEAYRPKAKENDLRGFEWHYLDRLCHSDELTLKGGGGNLPGDRAVAFSPDFKRLASYGDHSDQRTVKVWEAETGKELLALKGHTGLVGCLAFSPDGKRLASGAGQFGGTPATKVFGELKVWDAQTGQELLDCKGHTDAVTSMVFSPDRKTLASASRDKTVKVWDAQTGKELLTLKGHTNAVTSIDFSPDGKKLASASFDQTLKVWDAKSGKELLTLKGGYAGYTFTVAFSPDGQRLASGGDSAGGLKVWDAQTGELLLPFQAYATQVNCVAFSPNGKLLASGANDALVRIWDAKTGKELRRLTHDALIQTVAFSPDGTRLAAASYVGTIKFWGLTADPDTRTFAGHTGKVASIAISPDGKRLASSSFTYDETKKAVVAGEVKISDAQTGKELLSFKGHAGVVSSLAFSADGKRLASASKDDHTVKVWDAETGQELLTLALGPKGKAVVEFLQGGLTGVAFSPDGKHLATAAFEYVADKEKKKVKDPLNKEKEIQILFQHLEITVKVWDAQTGKELRVLQGVGPRLAFSPDGKRLANGGGGEVKVWDTETGKVLLSIKGTSVTEPGGKLGDVVFSPDGKRLASSTLKFAGGGPPGSGEVNVFDAQTGEELVTLRGLTGHLKSVVFSPDGKRLATADWWDNTVKVWHAQTGQELLTLTVNKDTGRVNSLAFSPDGKRLASNVMIWDATPRPERH